MGVFSYEAATITRLYIKKKKRLAYAVLCVLLCISCDDTSAEHLLLFSILVSQALLLMDLELEINWQIILSVGGACPSKKTQLLLRAWKNMFK